MALIHCSECNKEISNKADACIHCGAPISIDTTCNASPSKRFILGLLFKAGAVIAVLSVINAFILIFQAITENIDWSLAVIGITVNVLTIISIRATRSIYRKIWALNKKVIAIIFLWFNVIALSMILSMFYEYGNLSLEILFYFIGVCVFIDLILLMFMYILKK